MKDKLYIPKKIKVGYNKREDTYTKKLAYVIYYDDKGKLRKETSWDSWRDNQIPFDDFENEATTGFVLNKGVGGQRQSYGWNARNEYIRVYDPRGFEFEISVANLLFILQESNSMRGKGLEGEFIYSWSGKELVLLPVASEEYKQSVEFTNMQSNKISARDLKVGCEYLTKKVETIIYIGRFDYYSDYENKPRKGHIFYYPNMKNVHYRYWPNFKLHKNMNILAKLVSDVQVANYNTIMDEFAESGHASPLTNEFIFDNSETKKNDRRYVLRDNIVYRYVFTGNDKSGTITQDYIYGFVDNRVQSEYKYNHSSLNISLEPIETISNYGGSYHQYRREDFDNFGYSTFKIRMKNDKLININKLMH